MANSWGDRFAFWGCRAQSLGRRRLDQSCLWMRCQFAILDDVSFPIVIGTYGGYQREGVVFILFIFHIHLYCGGPPCPRSSVLGLRFPGFNFGSCVWRAVSSHHLWAVPLAQFSLYLHQSGLKLDSFHLLKRCYYCLLCVHCSWVRRHRYSPLLYKHVKCQSSNYGYLLMVMCVLGSDAPCQSRIVPKRTDIALKTFFFYDLSNLSVIRFASCVHLLCLFRQ